MKLIHQRHPYDCQVACAAMLFHMEYDEALSLILKHLDGNLEDAVPNETLILAGRELGMKLMYISGTMFKLPSIVTVPSLNIPFRLHSVFFEGGKIYDPSRKKGYSNVEEILSCYAGQLIDSRYEWIQDYINDKIEELKAHRICEKRN